VKRKRRTKTNPKTLKGNLHAPPIGKKKEKKKPSPNQSKGSKWGKKGKPLGRQLTRKGKK